MAITADRIEIRRASNDAHDPRRQEILVYDSDTGRLLIRARWNLDRSMLYGPYYEVHAMSDDVGPVLLCRHTKSAAYRIGVSTLLLEAVETITCRRCFDGWGDPCDLCVQTLGEELLLICGELMETTNGDYSGELVGSDGYAEKEF